MESYTLTDPEYNALTSIRVRRYVTLYTLARTAYNVWAHTESGTPESRRAARVYNKLNAASGQAWRNLSPNANK